MTKERPYSPHNMGQLEERNLTILIKSMDRQKCLQTLVSTIRGYHPDIPIYIADDGIQKTTVMNVTNVKQFYMPTDSGLSAGRNLLISQTTSTHVLLLDDDFSWRPEIIPWFIRVMNNYPWLDMVGGRAGLNFAGKFIVDNQTETLFLINEYYKLLNNSGVGTCYLVDFVPNFFLAKTKTLLSLMWDNRLKASDSQTGSPLNLPFLLAGWRT